MVAATTVVEHMEYYEATVKDHDKVMAMGRMEARTLTAHHNRAKGVLKHQLMVQDTNGLKSMPQT